MKVGQTHTESVAITPELVAQFAHVSGDFNPLHLNAEFAAETPFGKPIAHGMLSGALISGALGTRFPGEGAILLQMDIKFMRPIYVGDTATLRLTVEHVREDKPIVTVLCQVSNAQGEIAAEGRTILKVPITTR